MAIKVGKFYNGGVIVDCPIIIDPGPTNFVVDRDRFGESSRKTLPPIIDSFPTDLCWRLIEE